MKSRGADSNNPSYFPTSHLNLTHSTKHNYIYTFLKQQLQPKNVIIIKELQLIISTAI